MTRSIKRLKGIATQILLVIILDTHTVDDKELIDIATAW